MLCLPEGPHPGGAQRERERAHPAGAAAADEAHVQQREVGNHLRGFSSHTERQGDVTMIFM